MFESLIAVLKKDGYGINGFQKCRAMALNSGLTNGELAAPFYLLSAAAEHFINRYEGQPLPTQTAEEEFQKFVAYADILEQAFSVEDGSRRLAGLNSLAQIIIENK